MSTRKIYLHIIFITVLLIIVKMQLVWVPESKLVVCACNEVLFCVNEILLVVGKWMAPGNVNLIKIDQLQK